MKFGSLNEDQIKKAAGGALDKLIEIWHQDVSEKTGEKIVINLGNRRDSGSPVRGGILTDAALEMKASGKRLMIWYDPLELYYESRIKDAGYSTEVIAEMTQMLSEDRDPGLRFDPVSNPEKLDFDMIARQIGRWLLRFRGVKRLKNENSSFFELEAFINLECGIPALYALFGEAGFDRSGGEHKRLTEVYEGLLGMDEPSKRIDCALNALRVSNILEFSDQSELKIALVNLLKERFLRIQAMCAEIDQLKAGFCLSNADELNSFMRKLVLKYKMPGSWVSINETLGIL